ncbi:hypothetical protein V6R21_18850 [Limibacter armeniacum]|uniref:tetratricopeptide repeat protein n=1 Tax=Limibacter armeniacum TaxID=466084 RepID=UPI002FE5B7D9
MNQIIKNSITVILSAFLISFNAFAGTGDLRHSTAAKEIAELRTYVENAGSSNAEAYANAAQICINRGYNLQEAKAWIEHAIQLNSSPQNLEILGDYHYRTGKIADAYKAFNKALNLTFDHQVSEDEMARLQLKIQTTAKDLLNK